jgi:hypothetical protein
MSLRAILIATFIAVVISDLAECQPFSHYWQVLPDPGGQCRQGYAQLLTMAVCNILTDLSLVVFPVPLILGSTMTKTRKFQLVLLFSLSLAPVAVTIYRVPHILEAHGSQQARSLYASVELLFATAAANTLVLGSFVRDRGVKKKRYKYDSIAANSADRSSTVESRRPTAALRHWGSDEDLARDLGYGVKAELRDANPPPHTASRPYVPAPPVSPHQDMHAWPFSGPGSGPGQERPSMSLSEDLGDKATSRSDSSATNRRISFFDYGGLLESRGSDQPTPKSPTTIPSPTVPASGSGFRRGSAALLQDLGGFLTPPSFRQAKAKASTSRENIELSPIQQSRRVSPRSISPARGTSNNQEPELLDVGGLLEPPAR